MAGVRAAHRGHLPVRDRDGLTGPARSARPHGRQTLNTVSLYVTDQQKALDFYVGTLGFELRREADMGPMGRWLEVAPQGAQTGLMLARADGFGKQDRVGDSADLVFRTDDVTGLHDRLAAAQVPVTEPETQQRGTFIKVTDPDGHTFVVSQQS